MEQGLGLGTVQFGLEYGITNAAGKVPLDEVRRILARAEAEGVSTLDTAAAYGDSEKVVGCLVDKDSQFAIVTKTVPVRRSAIGDEELASIDAGFRQSLSHLQRNAVDTLLVHHADDLLVPGGERVYELLRGWREQGLVRRIGFSAYDRGQVEAVLARFPLEVVQLPVSVFDQRLVRDGTLAELQGRGIKVHARSVLLQGLLADEVPKLPPPLATFAPAMRSYREYLRHAEVSPMEAALGFVRGLPGVEVVLVGVVSERQLGECIAAYNANKTLDLCQFACDDPQLVDPRRWNS
jgi:aryl-alcohol dehydrogenase-like predicted oxidoreductase